METGTDRQTNKDTGTDRHADRSFFHPSPLGFTMEKKKWTWGGRKKKSNPKAKGVCTVETFTVVGQFISTFIICGWSIFNNVNVNVWWSTTPYNLYFGQGLWFGLGIEWMLMPMIGLWWP
jgi:hypothetical protein